MNMAIMPMRHEDIEEIVLADRLVFGHTLGEETLMNELDLNPFAHYFVMRDESAGRLAGHISLWIDIPNAQILNFYILPDYQGRKLGEKLLEFGLDYLAKHKIENITLEVRTSNERAIKIYEKYGFDRVAIRKQYYDNGEDAILMLKKCEVVNYDSNGYRD
ncbi:MAG: ribosomal protein S18-alanine N-acetyltransferase [Bacilli bacterium]|nr:ribosomal protein S18-alanine N-acetyltransferase [Bacilli bacterium]MBN2696657.1 ribosomal protein S18-alanine N-acetyltransferase [Bacilli bacterium]